MVGSSIGVIVASQPLMIVVAALEVLLFAGTAVAVLRGRENRSHLVRVLFIRQGASTIVAIAAVLAGQPSDGLQLAIAASGYALSVLWRLNLLSPRALTVWRYSHHLVSPAERFVRLPPVGAWLTAFAALSTGSTDPIIWFLAIGAGVLVVAWRGNHEPLELTALFWAAAIVDAQALALVGADRLHWVQVAHTDALGQLVTIQLVLDVIPITIAVAAAQLAINWLGVRAALAIPIGGAGLALVGAVVSIAIDVALFSTVSLSPYRLQLAEVLAGLTAALAFLAIAQLVKGLEPEAINIRLTRRLNRDWLDQVRHGHTAFGQRHIYRDRFDAVERVLHEVAFAEGDSQVAQDLLMRLEERIMHVGDLHTVVKDEIEDRGPDKQLESSLDSYLAARLQPLIDELASSEVLWALDQLLQLRHSLEPSRLKRVGTGTTAYRLQELPAPASFTKAIEDLPTGLLLYSTVASAAISNRIDVIAAAAFNRSRAYLRRALSDLPPSATVFRVSGVPRATQTFTEGDEFAMTLEHYLRQIEAWASECAEQSLTSAMRMLAWTLEEVLFAAASGDASWGRWLSRTAMAAISRVARLADRAGMRVYLPSRYTFPVDKTNPAHVEIVGAIDDWVPDMIVGLKHYDWFVRHDALEMAEGLASLFPRVSGHLSAAVAVAETAALAAGDKLPDEGTWRLIADVRKDCGAQSEDFDRAYVDALDRYKTLANVQVAEVYRSVAPSVVQTAPSDTGIPSGEVFE